ncbi:alpha/beta hydrolase-fold protein [Sphingomonas sp.]|uniref:carboxylesterase family protein n=1 Tax=Sphingomonas sp. TaxID=28214 RepID=UPI002DD61D78|nr:alpha/beta hydrolase-fold protein [Sphingomonas sp.]
MIRVFLALLLFVTGGAAAMAQQSPQEPVAKGGYQYQLYVPADHDADAARRWPVIVFLHGSGERGDDVTRVKVHGIPKVVERPGETHPYIAVSPLLPADEDWDFARLGAILDHVQRRFRTDPDRVYLTGLSRGGRGAWRWAAAEPGRFAAIAPVSGGGDLAKSCALKAMPIWAFHGDRDNIVPVRETFESVEAVRACGGTPRLTIYPDTGHDGWTPTYDNPELYTWLLAQRRAAPDQDQK